MRRQPHRHSHRNNVDESNGHYYNDLHDGDGHHDAVENGYVPADSAASEPLNTDDDGNNWRRTRAFKHKRSSLDVDLGGDGGENNNNNINGGNDYDVCEEKKDNYDAAAASTTNIDSQPGFTSNTSPLYLPPLPPPPPPPPSSRRRRRFRGGGGTRKGVIGYSNNNSSSNNSTSLSWHSLSSDMNQLWERILLVVMKKKSNSSSTAASNIHQHRTKESSQQFSTLVVAVMLWYSLGVISISTSKLLLTSPNDTGTADDSSSFYTTIGGLPPLYLTLQQLVLGCTFLRFLINIQFLGLSQGLQQPYDVPEESQSNLRDQNYTDTSNSSPSKSTTSTTATFLLTMWRKVSSSAARYLVLAGICFSLGFYTTNLAFGAASPSYVETIKAAEPITSAILAVTYGLERLTTMEISSLGGIITGMLVSTLASSSSPSPSSSSSSSSNIATNHSLLLAAIIVMASNLCFSLRGLYQKIYQRAIDATIKSIDTTDTNHSSLSAVISSSYPSPSFSSSSMSKLDDLNLQFRMQQIGVTIFLVPTLLKDGPRLFFHLIQVTTHLDTIELTTVILRYVALSVVNGLAFSSYKWVLSSRRLPACHGSKTIQPLLIPCPHWHMFLFPSILLPILRIWNHRSLASTYLLTRISVVHHAALNCTRRIFAIVVTSMIFGIPISFVSALGIALSFISFMMFTTAKAAKTKKARNQKLKNETTRMIGAADNERSSNYLLPTNTNGQQLQHRNPIVR